MRTEEVNKLNIINDLHIGSKYNDDENAFNKLNATPVDGNTYLNGDLVDMACCPKKDVRTLRDYQVCLLNKWKNHYIKGNHDLIPDQTAFAIHTLENESKDRVIITHGHLLGSAKRVQKWTKYEQKSAGAGKLKLIWVDFADDMDWLKGKRPLPKDVIRAAINMATLWGCKYVILGHFHPLKRIDHTEDGITVIFLPKGFNEVVFG